MWTLFGNLQCISNTALAVGCQSLWQPFEHTVFEDNPKDIYTAYEIEKYLICSIPLFSLFHLQWLV